MEYLKSKRILRNSMTEVIEVLRNFKRSKNLIILVNSAVNLLNLDSSHQKKKEKKFLVSCIFSIRSLIFKILKAYAMPEIYLRLPGVSFLLL